MGRGMGTTSPAVTVSSLVQRLPGLVLCLLQLLAHANASALMCAVRLMLRLVRTLLSPVAGLRLDG